MDRPLDRKREIPLFTLRTPRPRADIPSPEILRRILERERARTDRTGMDFSLVVIDPFAGGPADAGDLESLWDILHRRIRATDVVGMFGENSLGIVLPATPAEGAWKFANDVRARLIHGDRAPHCTVYSYPTSWFHSVPSAGDPPPGRSSGGGPEGPCGPVDAAGTGGKHGTVHRMERIFASPLPAWKRALDVVVASLALMLLSPLLLLIATAIRIASPGPVIFRQERVGHKGIPFTMWKLRTMHLGNEDGLHRRYLGELIRGGQPMVKLDSGRDTRIIPFGKILRQAGLDELPQLLNVIKGNMTLVGPRPCLPYEAEEYLPWHTRRFDVVPGLTGLWQVSGKNRTTFKEMIRFDIAYSRNISPWTDFKIMARTLPVILTQVADHFQEANKVR
jgi:lipopolysaccharide/colanic/teichoic acid biosynthesis glycosyltransferase